MDTANQYPPLPQKKRAVFHHPMGFELYDGLAMDMHAMAFAEPLLKEIDRLRAELSEQCRIIGMSSEREARHIAEIEELRRALRPLREDAERYRWIKTRKSLDLRSDCGEWRRSDGTTFTASHYLAEGGTQHAPAESLDETIDNARKA